MRQIKFRGKRKDNGEWVYGFYFEAPLTHETGDCASYLCGEKRYLISQGGVTFDVLPETVGQFTGLLDEDGVSAKEPEVCVWEARRKDPPMWYITCSAQASFCKLGGYCPYCGKRIETKP